MTRFRRAAASPARRSPDARLARRLEALEKKYDERSTQRPGDLNSATSRPFSKPKSGRIAVKVINHLGDEVVKVFRVRT